MKTYTFKRTHKGIYGDAFELAIKAALGLPETVSPAGRCDFRYKGKCYDSKQNGSIIRYAESKTYVKGSSRVIFATHIAYEVTDETEETISIAVNLAETDMFVLDKKEFVQFLADIGAMKYNSIRHEVNIQTCYNYKKDAYHGRTGRKIEAWAYEHDIDDGVIGAILAGLE